MICQKPSCLCPRRNRLKTITLRNPYGAQQRLLSYGLITAKKLILMEWKGKEVPTRRRWLTELTDTLHLEKIRYTIKDKPEQFDKIWRPLVSFLEQEPAS